VTNLVIILVPLAFAATFLCFFAWFERQEERRSEHLRDDNIGTGLEGRGATVSQGTSDRSNSVTDHQFDGGGDGGDD